MASRSPPNYVKNNDATVKTLLKTITQMSQRCKSQNATDQVLSRASSVIYQHFPHLKLRLDLQLPELITEALMMRGANIPNQITHNYNYKYDYNSNINNPAAAANAASNQHQNMNNGGGDAFMEFNQNASSSNAPPSFPNMPSTLSLPPNEEMELQKKVNEITRPLTVDSYKSLVVVIKHFVMQHIQSVNLQEAFNRLLSFEQMYEASVTAASTFFGNDNINALIRCIETKTGIRFTIGPDLCQELASIIVTVQSIYDFLSINSVERAMSKGYLTEITNVLSVWKSERLQLMEENNNAKIQIEESTMQLSTVKSELLEKNLQITSLQTINNQIDNYINTDLARNTNFQFNKSNNFEQNVIDAFKAANATIATLQNDLDRQNQYIQSNAQTKLKDQSQIESLQTQVQSLNVKNVTLNETNLKLLGENEQVKNELEIIRQELLQNNNAVSNLNGLYYELQQKNTQISNLQSIIDNQSAEIESLKQEVLNNSVIKPMKKIMPTKNVQLRSDTKTMAEVDKLKNEINEIKSLFALSKNNLISLNNTTEQNLTDKYNQAIAINKEKDDIINKKLNQLDEDYKTKIQTNINVQSQLSDELQILQHNFNRLEKDFNDNLENFEHYARRMAFLEYTENNYNIPDNDIDISDTDVVDIPDTTVNIKNVSPKNVSPNTLPVSPNILPIKNIKAIQVPVNYKINKENSS
ncbi:hypothetical protein AhnVgp057 [Adoxophyes honmai nucleopolyhedrovirus]|uniref:Uncharacterized protein n=1 Tax=Adoxophyes honmai nucleopolyhedrovirus TaxID=224399 RepID=Q80LN9_NPVAH|nr:hypothetical protein AhnVgp057 [Adoxophyes honmai nucleopolyhedrovirus]BAC67308.1 hypothetical protein [Adoxophyes honmai nucleopolyhedrovirus]